MKKLYNSMIKRLLIAVTVISAWFVGWYWAGVPDVAPGLVIILFLTWIIASIVIVVFFSMSVVFPEMLQDLLEEDI